MNASMVSRLNDVTAPLDVIAVPPTSNVLAPVKQPVDAGRLAELQWQPGRVLGYRYRIDRVLEIGGTATVYEATQLDLARRVAIKVISAECAADSPCARRFEREARTIAGLQHPHIVSAFELGMTEEGVAFMAMELVEGPTLRAYLLAERQLPWRLATECAVQLADALQCAHAGGVVHGDVSAANVLLARRGDTFVCKLIDFGAARRIGDGKPHLTCGTARYVAPELFGGEAPQVSSDLFALGTLLKEMLGKAELANCPQLLQHLVASMLNPDPQGRPESAAEVAMRLRSALDPQPVPASRFRARWMATAVIAGLGACAVVVYDKEREGDAPPPEPSVDTALRAAPLHAKPAASLKVTHVAATPRPRPLPLLPGTRATPVAVTGTLDASESAPDRVADPAPEAVDVAEHATSRDESVERVEIVESLDRWVNERNQGVTGERAPVTARRVGEPAIVFDPSGTSASVVYRKRLTNWTSSRVSESIVEEKVFFAKHSEGWQIVNPDSG